MSIHLIFLNMSKNLNEKFFSNIKLCLFMLLLGTSNLMTLNAWANNNLLPPNAVDLILYRSKNTQKFYSSVGANEQLLLAPWKNYAQQYRFSMKEITELNQLAELRNQPNQVLILASALALDEKEKAAILKYQRAGGAVLGTWATGSRDGNGQWAGWSFLQELADVQVMRELPADGTENYAVIRGEGPLTHTLPAGYRIWLGKVSERPFIMRGTTVAAWGTNWIRQIQAKALGDGLVLHTERAEPITHRVAVFGFSETSWEYQLSDIHQLVSGTLSWLVRTPVVLKANWPKGRVAAYMIAMDTEEQFQNSRYLIEQFSKFDYRGTFYLLTSQAKKYPEIIKSIEKEGHDLGYHGDVHDSFKNQSVALKTERIERMIAELSSAMAKPKVGNGFRAPTEGFDPDVNSLLYQAGIRHHLADPNQGNGRLPFFASVENEKKNDRFVVFPRTTRDDFNLRQEAGPNASALTQLMIDDFESGRLQGAFGMLSLHSHLVSADTPLGQAFPEFLKYAKNQNSVWLASGKEVATWWNEKERYQIKTNKSVVEVTISGPGVFNDAAFIVLLGNKNKLPEIKKLTSKAPTPTVIRLDDYRLLVVPGPLQPGAYQYQIQI